MFAFSQCCVFNVVLMFKVRNMKCRVDLIKLQRT